MSDTKIAPDLPRTALHIARRLAAVRSELFGKDGHSRMAKRIGVPVQSWRNFERGVAAPPDIILTVIVLFDVEPQWLLNGEGPTFRA